jgi:thioredoxin-like negative regulator of GroEL
MTRWITGLLLLSAHIAQATAVRPVDPALELAHDLPAYRVPRGVPQDAGVAIEQARALIEEGRKRADIRAFAYADTVLAPFAARAAVDSQLALLLADIHQYRHDFKGAAQLLDQVLARDPRDSNARLMRAQIRIAQGNGHEALRDCLHLVGREAAWVWSACSAQAYAISGRLDDAQRLLATNLRGQELQGPRGAWVAGIMAQLAEQTGDRAAEESWLRRALAADADDHVAAISLIDLLNASGRQTQALQLLAGRPASDAYLIRKAQALQTSDAAQAQQIMTEMRRRFAESDALGDRTHLRERADFELRFGDARAALALAQENFRTQRELTDVRLLLQAAAAVRNPSGGSAAVQWLRDTRAQDAQATGMARVLGGAA